MSKNLIFPAFSQQVALASIAISLFSIFNMDSETSYMGMFLIIMIYACVNSILNQIFVIKPKSGVQLAIFDLLHAVAAFLCCLFTGYIQTVGNGIFVAIVLFVTAALSIKSLMDGIQSDNLVITFEVLLVAAVAFIGIATSKSADLSPVVFMIIGFLFEIAGIVVFRAGKRFKFRNILPAILIIFVAFLIAYIIYKLALDPLSEGLLEIWKGIVAALAFIWGLIKQFFLWFSTLLKPEKYEAVEMEEMARSGSGERMFSEEGNFSVVPLIVIIAIAFIIAATLIILLIHRKNIHGSGKVVQVKRTVYKSERVSLLEAFKIWFGKIAYKHKVNVFIRSNRNAPVGQYFALIKRCRNTKLAKRTGETPQEFIERYISSLDADDKRIGNLKELTRAVNLYLYSK